MRFYHCNIRQCTVRLEDFVNLVYACFPIYVRQEVVCKLLKVADLRSAPFVLNASLK